MNIDRAIILFAGTMILISTALTHFVHYNWIWLTVFAGLNLVQSSITGFCPPAFLFRKLGMKSGCAYKGKEN